MKDKLLVIVAALLLAANIMWSVRLESRAAKLADQVEQYHQNLLLGKDEMSPSSFKRQIGSSELTMDGSTAMVKADKVVISAGLEHTVIVDKANNSVLITSDMAQIGLVNQPKQRASYGVIGTGLITVEDGDGISISAVGNNPIQASCGSDLQMLMHPGNGFCKLKKGSAEVTLGNKDVLGTPVPGAFFGDSSAGFLWFSQDGGAMLSAKGHLLGLSGDEGMNVEFDGDIVIKTKGALTLEADGAVKIKGATIDLNE